MSLPDDHRVAMDAVVKLAVAAVDLGATGHRRATLDELRAGHGRTHLRRARLGGATTSSGVRCSSCVLASRLPAAAVGRDARRQIAIRRPQRRPARERRFLAQAQVFGPGAHGGGGGRLTG
nr:unnamed protein product [Digitaria exilis]